MRHVRGASSAARSLVGGAVPVVPPAGFRAGRARSGEPRGGRERALGSLAGARVRARGLSCLLASTVPLLAPVLYAVAMITANFFLIRGPLRWLSPARRLTTRLSLKVLLAGLTVVNVVLSVAIFPLEGVAQLTTAMLSVGLAIAYVAAALRLTARALRREGAREPLHPAEWLPPTLALGSMVAFVVIVSALVGSAFWLLLQADIPGVSTLVDWLMGEGSP